MPHINPLIPFNNTYLNNDADVIARQVFGPRPNPRDVDITFKGDITSEIISFVGRRQIPPPEVQAGSGITITLNALGPVISANAGTPDNDQFILAGRAYDPLRALPDMNLHQVTFGNTTDSTSKDTGAVIIEGGLGVEKAVSIGTKLGVGVAPSTNTTILSTQTFTNTSGTVTGIDGVAYINPDFASSATVMGVSGEVFVTSGNTKAIGSLAALKGVVTHQGTNSVDESWGVLIGINNLSTGTLTAARGILISTFGNTGGGVITNAIGLDVENQTAGSTNYAIRTGTGQVALGELLRVGSVASESSPSSYQAIFAHNIAAGAGLFSFSNYSAVSTSNAVGLQVRLITSVQSRTAFQISTSFSTTTDASRTSTIVFQSADAGTFATYETVLGKAVTFAGAVTVVGDLTLSASDIITDTTTGTKIATGATQKLGFFGATPIVQGTAFTQTYSTAAHTITQTTMTDPAAYAAGANGYSTGAMASAIHAEVIALRANMIVTQNVLNSVIDDLQALGLVA